jgi:IS30 family transposase
LTYHLQEIQRHNLHIEDIFKIKELIENGYSSSYISKQCNVSEYTVNDIKRNKIPTLCINRIQNDMNRIKRFSFQKGQTDLFG